VGKVLLDFEWTIADWARVVTMLEDAGY